MKLKQGQTVIHVKTGERGKVVGLNREAGRYHVQWQVVITSESDRTVRAAW